MHDTTERTLRHLNVFRYPAYVHARDTRILCNEHGKKTVNVPWASRGSGFFLHFEALIVEMCREMPPLAVSRMIGMSDDSVWRIMRHYVDEAREKRVILAPQCRELMNSQLKSIMSM